MLGVLQGFLGGGSHIFIFTATWGNDSHFDSYFSTGLKPPTRLVFCKVFHLCKFPRSNGQILGDFPCRPVICSLILEGITFW